MGVVLLVWAGAVVVASGSGWLATSGRYSPPIVAAGTMLLPLLVFAVWPGLRRWVEAVGVRRLTAVHVLRGTATPLFLWYGSHGLLPQVFAQRAGWGDLVAAAAALVAITVWPRPAGYLVAQLVGMADFADAFATAIPLARLDPMAMHAVTRLPLALIPFFLVGLLAATHAMVLYLLVRVAPAEPCSNSTRGETG